MVRRAFTVDEANALLPHVRRVLERLRETVGQAAGHRDKLAVLDALWSDEVHQPTNPDHEEFVGHRQALEQGATDVEGLIKRGLLERGIRFPVGGLRNGLVDFPTTLDGRWVYLCWQYGEAEVRFWHEVDGGYRGRRAITAEIRRRMARPDDPIRHDYSTLDF
jgi:hypothetical protein